MGIGRPAKYPPLVVGNRYDMLVVKEILSYKKCIVRCDCGEVKEAYVTNITSGRQGTCGCQQRRKRDRARTPLLAKVWA